MFRIGLDITHIDYSTAMENIIRTARENPELMGGMKLPPFFNAGMLKMIPDAQKNAYLVQGISQGKDRIIPMLTAQISPLAGAVQIHDISASAPGRDGAALEISIEIADLDRARVIELICTKLLQQEDIPAILQEHYENSITMENLAFYMNGQQPATQEYLIVKSLSVRKQTLKGLIEAQAGQKGFPMQIAGLHFFYKAD